MALRGARRPRSLRLVPAPRLSGSSAFGRRAAVRVDVLHHTSDARILLREAARVSRRYIVIKDHLREGPFAKVTLQAMDWIGNYGHDVVLPYNYLSKQEWYEHFRDTNLSPERWTESLGLYPFPFSLVFGRRLHFIARLTISSLANASFR